MRLAQLLADQKGNPFKIKAYRRAAKTIQTLGDSFDELVRSNADLTAENARLANQAGVKITVNTDAHSTRELDLIKYGIGHARRAGLSAASILNCQTWPNLRRIIKR